MITITIRDGLPNVICEGLTYHKALGNNVEILPDDWIRVYTGRNGVIKELIFTCDYKDLNKMPDEVLNLEYDEQGNWLIGGYLSVDFIINK